MSDALNKLDEAEPVADETGEPTNGERETRVWWAVSIAVSIVLALLLVWLWSLKLRSKLETTQLVDQETVDAFLLDHWQTRTQPDAVTLPTGIFVQSLGFLNTSDVHMTGYIWQRRTDGVHDNLDEGFVLPEQIDSFVEPREEYRVRSGDEEVIGWHFEGAFRQPFDYQDYPFDQQMVWMRIWPKDFGANVVLVPDLAAYPCPTQPERSCTGLDDVFGVQETIVLDEFERRDTYFDYALSSYNSNFGIDGYVGQTGFPELRYNIVLARQIDDTFIIYFVPLMVVAAFAFIALITTTLHRIKTSRFGYNTFGLNAVITALFFVLVLAQGQLRLQFAGFGFVYLELFYFVMYVVLLAVAVNAYLVSSPGSSEWRIIRYHDDLIVKVSYWPILLGAMVVITAFSL